MFLINDIRITRYPHGKQNFELLLQTKHKNYLKRYHSSKHKKHKSSRKKLPVEIIFATLGLAKISSDSKRIKLLNFKKQQIKLF